MAENENSFTDYCNEPYEERRGLRVRTLYCQRSKGHSGIHRKGISAVEMRRKGYRRNAGGRFYKSNDPRA